MFVQKRRALRKRLGVRIRLGHLLERGARGREQAMAHGQVQLAHHMQVARQEQIPHLQHAARKGILHRDNPRDALPSGHSVEHAGERGTTTRRCVITEPGSQGLFPVGAGLTLKSHGGRGWGVRVETSHSPRAVPGHGHAQPGRAAPDAPELAASTR